MRSCLLERPTPIRSDQHQARLSSRLFRPRGYFAELAPPVARSSKSTSIQLPSLAHRCRRIARQSRLRYDRFCGG